MSYEVICPYCDHVNNMEPSDGFYDGEHDETECEECEKRFMYTVAFRISIESRAAHCLNDGNHDFKKYFGHMRCQTCYLSRPCTAEELEAL